MANTNTSCSLLRQILSFLSLVLLAARVEAIYFLTQDFNMVVGQTHVLTWNYLHGQAQITLGGAGPNNTHFNMSIGSGLGKNRFQWVPPPTIQTGLYILELQDWNSVDWSPVFTIINYGNQTWQVPTTSATSMPTQPASTTPAAAGPPPNNHLAENIGIGLGAALGASLNIGFIIFVICRTRRKRRALRGEDGGEVFPLTGQRKLTRSEFLGPLAGRWWARKDDGLAPEGEQLAPQQEQQELQEHENEHENEEDELTLVGSARASWRGMDDGLDSGGGGSSGSGEERKAHSLLGDEKVP